MFRLRFRLFDIMKFIALCALFLALFHWIAGDLAIAADWPRSVLYPLAVSVLCAWSVMRRRSKSLRCKNCGNKMLPSLSDPEGGTCPACSVRKLPPQVRHRVGVVVLLVIAILIAALPFVLLWPFAGLLENAWGRFAYPAISIGLFVLLFALVFGFLATRLLVGMWRMANPAHALSVARASAHETPTEHTVGPASVFCFGSDDPTSLLAEALKIVSRQFKGRIGDPIASTRPLRFFVFGERTAFERVLETKSFERGQPRRLVHPLEHANDRHHDRDP